MNTEEAYRALIEAIAAYVMAVAHDAASGTTKDSVGAKEDMIAAIRAYGAARELKGHVDACESTEGDRMVDGKYHIVHCGAGWYCGDAREIEELGK